MASGSVSGPISIFTDGACIGPPTARTGGIGVYFANGDASWNVSEPLTGTLQTNQRAELTAMLRAYNVLDDKAVPIDAPVTIHSDSDYSIKCVTTWRTAWVANGWRTASRQPVKNRDLIEPLCALFDRRAPHTAITWVKAHTGKKDGNYFADALASRAAANAMHQQNE